MKGKYAVRVELIGEAEDVIWKDWFELPIDAPTKMWTHKLGVLMRATWDAIRVRLA